jgi:hypothetical protein
MRIARCGSEEESSLIAGMVQGWVQPPKGAAANESINY